MDCKDCGDLISPRRLKFAPDTEVCARCQEKRRYQKTKPRRGQYLSKSQIGAASELMVAADLLSKGYEVFRSVSACGTCDLVILKDDKFSRVEVKTGYETGSGAVKGAQVRHPTDILATCIPEEYRIVYTGELEADQSHGGVKERK